MFKKCKTVSGHNTNTTTSDSNKIAYLNLIQGVITRLSNHNTTVRNWTVVSLIGLATIEMNLPFNPFIEGSINLIPMGLFVWMSLFYHWQSTNYIALYEKVISENCSDFLFHLRPKKIKRKYGMRNYKSFLKSTFSSYFNMFFCLFILLSAFFCPFIISLQRHLLSNYTP